MLRSIVHDGGTPPLSRFCLLSLALLLGYFTAPPSAAGPDSHILNGFVENRGQVNAAARYYARLAGLNVAFMSDGIMIDLRDSVSRVDGSPVYDDLQFGGRSGLKQRKQDPVRHWALKIVFPNAEAAQYDIEPVGRMPGRLNFYRGAKPGEWLTDVPTFEAVRYRERGTGRSIEFTIRRGVLHYAWTKEAHPGSAESPLMFRGAEDVLDRDDGIRVAITPIGRILQIPEVGDPSAGDIVRGGEGLVTTGRDSDTRDIRTNDDSLLPWSTFLGGSDTDFGRAIIIDDSQEILVTGLTWSTDFPSTVGAWDESANGDSDAFVAKISRDGDELIWCTYVGGQGSDEGTDLALATSPLGAPDIAVCGWTSSSDFPTTDSAWDRSLGGAADAFVLKLHHGGGFIYSSTLLGGDDSDVAFAIGVDENRETTLTGWTSSTDFPTTTGAFDETYNGSTYDAFATKMNETSSALLWSTFIGGSGWEHGTDLVLGADGEARICGWSDSPDFPTTTGAFQEDLMQWADVFVCQLTNDGTDLVWSTYVGGHGSDSGNGVALDDNGNVLVCGETQSTDFPTTDGAYDRVHHGDWDGFVLKLDATGSNLMWGTYLGAYTPEPYYGDSVMEIAVDRDGQPVVVGITDSETFPTTSAAYDTSYNGGYWRDGLPRADYDRGDAFVAMFDRSGEELLYSSYLGGSLYERAWGVALDVRGNPIVIGVTGSADFPATIDGFDPSHNGESDVFISKMWVQPTANGNDSFVKDVVGLRVGPSVGGSEVRIWWNAGSAGRRLVEVYDVQGRVLRRLLGEDGSVTWDLRDAGQRRVSSGTYWVSLHLENGRRVSRRLVVLN